MFVVTPQLVFMALGIVAFVASAILLVVAIAYFFRQDIRGVMDDLSGRTRQRGAGEARRQTRGRASTRRAAQPVPGAPAEEPDVREVPGGVVQPSEDELDTVLDTKLRKVSQAYTPINSDKHDVNDDMPTLVTTLGDYHQNNVAESKLGDADEPTVVDEMGDDLPTEVDDPTQVEGAAVVGSPSFVLTRSVIAINSNEVITAG